MLRTLLVLIFAGLATGAILFAVLIYAVKFDTSSNLGQAFRERLIRIPWFVELINLNQPGDGRYIYAKKGEALKIHVVHGGGTVPDADSKSWLETMVGETVGKEALVEVEPDVTIFTRETYSDEDLNVIRKSLVGRDSDLHIVYLTKYQEEPDYLGVTLHRDTIFVFKDRILTLTRGTDIRKRLEQSTLMHEWGHLLGLEHVEDVGCVMSEYVETYTNRALTPEQIPVTHCASTLYDLDLLNKLAN